MTNSQIFVARELLDLAAVVRDSGHLLKLLNGRSVLAAPSALEEGRTLELVLLEEHDSFIDFAAFSDGPSGVFGTGGQARVDGVRLREVQLFEDGVPVATVKTEP